MIALEHDAGVIRHGSRSFHALDREEQRTLLTQWYKRHSGGVDGTTLEPATAGDHLALLAATRGRKKAERPEASEAVVDSLRERRDAALARRRGKED